MKNEALVVLRELNRAGYEAFFIGGSIRNEFHNKFHNSNLPIKDYDIATNASYDVVSKIFPMADTRGEQFKVAVVRIPFSVNEFEVAQYRGESYPEEGSLRPNEVYTVDTLVEDVSRRDFTMNGIAQDKDGNIIDHVGGVEDIKNKVIRTIGDPNERFAEDPLRMLRAIRFVSQLGYDVEETTKDGIKRNLPRLSKIPHERVKEEINKVLKGKYVHKAFALMKELEVYKYSFYNSILKKEVQLLDAVFNLSSRDYTSTLFYLLDNQKISIIDIYFVLYMYVDYEKALLELNDSMFLNNDDIFKVKIMLKHCDIYRHQDEIALHSLVKDVGDQRGMTYLKDIVDSYSKVFNKDLKNVKAMLNRPLFKSQLPFTGEDVLAEGAKQGILNKGKWIGSVLDLAQKKSIFGEQYTLASLVGEITNIKETIK